MSSNASISFVLYEAYTIARVDARLLENNEGKLIHDKMGRGPEIKHCK
ncbi:MAG: hypothetical protein WCQ70_06075 [Lentimicrobiaceae bacterium]